MDGSFKSLQGHLLLDSGQLAGSFFHRSVVLICRHNEEGAFGLILNRPADSTLGRALDGTLPDGLSDQPLFIGGPVEAGALSYLHADAFLPGASVMDNLELGHSLEELTDLGGSFSPDRKLRVFAGYSGWSPGQLESELRRGAWLTHPADLRLVFDESAATLWSRILSRKGGWRNRLRASAPEDLSWN